jgi:hypothetical protein
MLDDMNNLLGNHRQEPAKPALGGAGFFEGYRFPSRALAAAREEA